MGSVFRHDPTAIVVIHSDVLTEADLAPWRERKFQIYLVPLDFIRWTTNNFWFSYVVDRK